MNNTVLDLLTRIKEAKTVEEIKEIESMLPILTPEEEKVAHERLDDGIYDEYGTLIGEKHPDD